MQVSIALICTHFIATFLLNCSECILINKNVFTCLSHSKKKNWKVKGTAIIALPKPERVAALAILSCSMTTKSLKCLSQFYTSSYTTIINVTSP